MKKANLLLVLLALGTVNAQSERDSVVQNYLSNVDVERQPFWYAFKNITTLSVDIDGDGVVERLFTFNGVAGRDGSSWSAYSMNGGTLSSIVSPETGLIFRPDMFFVGKVDEIKRWCLLAYHPGKGGGEVDAFSLSADRITVEHLPNRNLDQPKDAAFFQKYFAGPDEAHPYRSLVDHHPVQIEMKDLLAQGYDLSSVTRAIEHRNSVDAAVSKAQPILHPPVEGTKTVPPKKLEHPAVSVEVPAASPSKESSSTPWSIIVVLIVAVIGLLWLLLKRRS